MVYHYILNKHETTKWFITIFSINVKPPNEATFSGQVTKTTDMIFKRDYPKKVLG
jgi:hypothetical protein